ncbi:MAG: glycosyltransferase family 39 protein [Proteobacteria bacterium]|nr:glycosyltransferase family 39 protein [Pseudomonadota bacterium]
MAFDFATRPRRTFFYLLAATLLFRCWLAAAMPITGDEAYFIWWGKIPDWGFYDHPPMIGWWLAGLLTVSDAEWWLRLPAVLLPGALALGTARALRRHGEVIAWGGAILVLLAPADVWNVFITTDTPLIYFSFFSALAFLRAARDDDRRYYALAGLLLAGAVLSKYFAALLGFAYLLHALLRPNKRKLTGLLWCYAGVLPALALMAWWNAGHCWPNYMFNFVNRHGDAGWSARTPLLYAATLLYLLTPPVIWLLVKRRAVVATHWAMAEGRAMMLVAFAPLALFAGLSLVKLIGLHWVLSFLPFVFMLLVQAIEIATLRRLVNFFIVFAALHVVAIVAVAQFPLEAWQRTRLYDGIVLTFESQQLLEHLRPYEQDYVFASDGYSNAVTLGYNARRYFLVFGEASSHARHDDILTDFRELAGRNILILRKSPPEPGYYETYFREVETQRFTVRGAMFYMVLGRGFDYPTYRERVLAKVRDKYYAIPAWLPQNGCYFCERYFPGTVCRK